MELMEINGLAAIVTGGGSGLGAETARQLAAKGAKVALFDVNMEGAQAVAAEIGGLAIDCDVTSDEGVAAAIAQAQAAHGVARILINAAGIEIEETIETATLDQWNRIFAINVTGTFLTSKHALPLLRESEGHASIINFGSYDGFIADPELAAYCATKGAVHALTKAMACDHSPEGIRVNAVCPGYVDTPMLQSFFQENGDIDSLQQAVRDVHPLRTYGTPTDIANLVNWLASDEARYASGQLWVLDGGLSAQVQQMRL